MLQNMMEPPQEFPSLNPDETKQERQLGPAHSVWNRPPSIVYDATPTQNQATAMETKGGAAPAAKPSPDNGAIQKMVNDTAVAASAKADKQLKALQEANFQFKAKQKEFAMTTKAQGELRDKAMTSLAAPTIRFTEFHVNATECFSLRDKQSEARFVQQEKMMEQLQLAMTSQEINLEQLEKLTASRAAATQNLKQMMQQVIQQQKSPSNSGASAAVASQQEGG